MNSNSRSQLENLQLSREETDGADSSLPLSTGVINELGAAIVVACVAIPMGMGIATISGAPPTAGIISGIIGGLLVGSLSGSPTSITGPSAGLSLVIASLMGTVNNSFETFLLAAVIAGVLQILFGIAKLGWLSSFFPSSVLDALLAAIGIILVFKQIPHLLGHDTDTEGDMAFLQPDRRTTFSELVSLFEGDVHGGAATVGLFTLALILALQYFSRSKPRQIPSVLIGVVCGTLASFVVNRLGEAWVIDGKHLIGLPEWKDEGWRSLIRFPDISQYSNLSVYITAFAIAVVASLETLLNLSATDRVDRSDRPSPPNRELIAVGLGNLTSGLLGGIPMSAAIERSAVCLQSGSRTKLCAILHGIVLLIAALVLPGIFNMIPLSVLAAVLIVTGCWLARPAMFVRIWQGGRYQVVPFFVTIAAILLTDLLIGVVVGLVFGVGFILNSNLRRPLRQVVERHASGEILHIELAEQVSFLNRPVIERALRAAAPGTHILLDATNSDYIDPDILVMIRDFAKKSSLHKVKVSLRGFRQKYAIDNVIQFVDFTSREIQEKMTPQEALKILQDGNERFCSNQRLSRDLGRQVQATSAGQHPFAAILSCIDSRAPVETIMDLGVGDCFTARVAGNVVSPKILGSLEYATAVVGSKLIVVLGHTKCGAVHAAVKLADAGTTGAEATGCQHLDSILEEIHPSINLPQLKIIDSTDISARDQFAENVARLNVVQSVRNIVETSSTIRKLVDERRVAVVGAVYDVTSGKVEFMLNDAIGLSTN